MFVHLFVTIAIAAIACLMFWAIGRHLNRPLPGYALPMVGALVAIGYGIYAEYSWGGRTEEALPDSFVVLQRIEARSAMSPWTWLVPATVRLSAIDASAVRRHPAHRELRMLDVLLFERFYPVRRITQLVDCAGARRADLTADEAFATDGLPAQPNWRDVDADDQVISATCADAP